MAYYSAVDNSPSKFLSGVGFQFSLKKLPGVSYYCQSATVPSLNLAVANQPTRWKSLPEPGDEMNYDDLTIRFLVDEDMKNYLSIHDWMRYLGYPESDKDWTTFADGESYEEKQFSDGSLFILNSNFQRKFEVIFKDLFPVSLGSLALDSTYTDTEYFAIDATFKYSIYDIKEVGATSFFKPASLITPTVTLTSALGTNNAGEDILNLYYTSTGAETLVIGNGIGAVAVNGTGVTVKVADIQHLSYNGVISYTITATSKDYLTAEATTTKTLPVAQTSANRTCIAIIDESDNQSMTGMATKWNTFRASYPDRVFWLLQPNNNTTGPAWSSQIDQIYELRIPPEFMEETDPATYVP